MNPDKILVDTLTKVYRNGLTTTSGGNLSVRGENGDIFITPSGKDKGTLSPEDIVKVANDGAVTGKHKPSMELPFHSKIYKLRPEINAVLHVHSPFLVAYSLLGLAPDVFINAYIAQTVGKVGFSGYDIPGSSELGKKIASEIEKGYDAVMMQNHGAVFIAGSMEIAYQKLEASELCAKIHAYAKLLKKPVLSNSNVSFVNNTVGSNACDDPEIFAFKKRSLEHNYFIERFGAISTRTNDGFKHSDMSETEYAVHKNIYKNRPEINSVFTSIPPCVMAFAATDTELDSRTVPESYIMMRDTVRLKAGDEINAGERISPSRPVALSPSMLITTGENITKAFDRTEVSEVTAKNLLITKMLGGDVLNISPAEIDKIDKYFNLPKD